MINWICVGTTLELPKDGSFISRTALGIPVVLQRFGDDIQCFTNVCSHRGSELRKVGSDGCGPLRCPYHGWQFGAGGVPTAVPSRAEFSPADIRPLMKWQAEVVGSLIFVNMSPGKTLRETIGGKHYDLLADMTANLGDMIDDYRRPIEAHWSIVVENTLEAYHVPFVHGESIGRMKIARCETWRAGNGSGMVAEVDHGKSASVVESLVPELAARVPRLHGYMHLFIYPNFTLATTHGMTYALQFIEPVATGFGQPLPARTNFRSLLYAARLPGNIPDSRKPLLRALNSSVAQMNRQTFDEDAEVCEGNQRGVNWSVDGQCVALAASEERIRWFREERGVQ